MLKTALRFGLLAVALMLLLYLSKYSIFTYDMTNQLLVVALAILLIGFGILISKYLQSQKKRDGIDHKKIMQLGISTREYEALNLIAEGKSNQEIADILFISESTVKTHVSNLLVKLDAKRRTEAIQLAKEMGIL